MSGHCRAVFYYGLFSEGLLSEVLLYIERLHTVLHTSIVFVWIK